jgi:hypothetical protein
MASVMEIGGEVFHGCAEDICISVELKNADVFLCCGWKYVRFILVAKAA